MAFYQRIPDRKRLENRHQEEEVIGSLCRLGGRPISPKTLLEHEKRIRREIANSNERRRMQSINAGFQSLRSLIPHRDGEKLSKAAILQSTADYVYQLEEKIRIMEQINNFPRHILNSPQHSQDSDGSCIDLPIPKKRRRDATDSIDEGIGCASPIRSDNEVDDVKKENIELRLQLDHERALRMILEEQLKNIDCRLYSSDCISDASDQIHLHYHDGNEVIEKASIINLGLESGLGSPQSQISSQDVESSHEFSPRPSSPELTNSEIPEDLSGKSNTVLFPCTNELSLSNVSNIPGLLLSSSSEHTASISNENNNSHLLDYKVSTSRQNLETIVEAIRHVEGDHMFRDDPKSKNSETNQCVKGKLSSFVQAQLLEQSHSICTIKNGNVSLQNQTIREHLPHTPARPGVIVTVSNHS